MIRPREVRGLIERLDDVNHHGLCAAEPGIHTYADLPVITSARRLGTPSG